MARNSNLNIRVDPQDKSAAEEIYGEYGLTISDAVNIFLKKSIKVHGLPFDLRPDYNETTLAAMKEADDMLSGKVPMDVTTTDDFMAELLDE